MLYHSVSYLQVLFSRQPKKGMSNSVEVQAVDILLLSGRSFLYKCSKEELLEDSPYLQRREEELQVVLDPLVL